MPATNDTPASSTATDQPVGCHRAEKPYPHWVHDDPHTEQPRPGVFVFWCGACGIELVD